MVLRKQNVPVVFTNGIDSKTDHKLTTKLTTLQNGVFKKAGSIHKREGYDQVGTNIQPAADAYEGLELSTSGNADAYSLLTYKDSLIQIGVSGVLHYSDSAEKWFYSGEYTPIDLSTTPVIQTSQETLAVDSATLSGFTGYVYTIQDADGGVTTKVRFKDSETDTIVHNQEYDSTSFLDSLMIPAGDKFVLLGIGTGSTYYLQADCYSLSNLSNDAGDQIAPTSIVFDGTGGNPEIRIDDYLDAKYIDGYLYAAYTKIGAAHIGVLKLDEDLAVTSSGTIATDYADAGISIAGTDTQIWVSFINFSGDAKAVAFDTDLNIEVSEFVLASGSTAGYTEITSIEDTSLSGVEGICFFLDDAVTTSGLGVTKTTYHTRFGFADENQTPTLIETDNKLRIYSKPFSYGEDKVNFVGYHDSVTQPTYVVAQYDLRAKSVSDIADYFNYPLVIHPLEAGGTVDRGRPASVTTNGNTHSLATLRNIKFTIEDNSYYFLTGVNQTSLSFEPKVEQVKFGENVYTYPGGVFQIDGESIVEASHMVYPDWLSTSGTTGGSLTSTGAYQYRAVYKFVDNNGLEHLSVPSLAASVTLAGGENAVAIEVPAVLIENRKTRPAMVIDIYRTEDAGTVFYKAGSVPSSKASHIVTFTDTLADSDLIGKELLYTTGGILENDTPPAAKAAAIYNDRIILISAEDPKTVWFSKERKKGKPAEFSAFFTFTVEPEGGDLTAIGIITDKAILFKKDRIYYFYGDGANDAGLLGGFSKPQLLSTDVGCINYRSVVQIPDGLIFKSEKGIYRLSSNLQVDYIGADIEYWNSEVITSATNVDDENEARFLTESGSCLVYNYYFNQWSTFTNHSGKDAVMHSDTYTYLNDSGAILQQTIDEFDDNGSDIPLTIGTGWIATAGIQGFQRIRRVNVLGDYKSPHTLRMKVFYDYSPEVAETIDFDTTDSDIDLSVISESVIYGESEWSGGETDMFMYRHHLKKQKCTAIRFEFEDLNASGTKESFSLTGIVVEAGIKEGANKLKGGQTV